MKKIFAFVFGMSYTLLIYMAFGFKFETGFDAGMLTIMAPVVGALTFIGYNIFESENKNDN